MSTLTFPAPSSHIVTQRLRIMEFTLDHEAPYFSNMRRRTSRKDSDLNGVVDVRYTGGARMLLLIEVGTGRWRVKIPVMVSDLDLESKLWLKIRLAPMCPWIGTLGLGFVGPPSIKVQLNPYNRIRLMKIPILQAFLTKFFTVDLPALITLPKRLEINIPPAVTAGEPPLQPVAVGHAAQAQDARLLRCA
jgi:Ca2+-dependent lipid-binding protein